MYQRIASTLASDDSAEYEFWVIPWTNTCEVIGYYGTNAVLNFPSFDTMGNEVIGATYFSFYNGVQPGTSLIFPEGYAYIGNDAFLYGDDLVSVTFPESLESIGTCAFYGAGFERVEIPRHVTNIGDGSPSGQTFANCLNLTNITIRQNPSTSPLVAMGYPDGGFYTEDDTFALVTYITPKVTVDFNSNGGSAISSTTIDFNSAVARPTPNPSKSSFVFEGWYSDSALTIPWNFASYVTKDMTLYAKWYPATVQLTWDPYGGTLHASTVSPQTVANRAIVTAPSAPTRMGWTFKGWFTQASGGSEWLFATSKPQDSNFTLYARWEINTYKVTYRGNGGYPDSREVTYNYGVTPNPAPLPTRAHYTLVEWRTNPNDPATKWTPGPIAASVTVYAVWKLDTFTINFDTDGGQGTFSSKEVGYGEHIPLSEESPTTPINPYGASKLAFEKALATSKVEAVVFRYFNAAGATPDGALGESHNPETHLIPRVLGALAAREPVTIFGNDYPTHDGTCVRDYIHVCDIASAHLLAIEALGRGEQGGTYNLGNGAGYSNLEVVRECEKACQQNTATDVLFGPRREGDPATLIASSQAAGKRFGWQPKYPDLATIVAHAFASFTQTSRIDDSEMLN